MYLRICTVESKELIHCLVFGNKKMRCGSGKKRFSIPCRAATSKGGWCGNVVFLGRSNTTPTVSSFHSHYPLPITVSTRNERIVQVIIENGWKGPRLSKWKIADMVDSNQETLIYILLD